jgi:hypothetical protein
MRLRMSPTTGLSFALMRQPSAVQSAATTIRLDRELVNEMGIQFFDGGAPVVLSGAVQANVTIFCSHEAGAIHLSAMRIDGFLRRIRSSQ